MNANAQDIMLDIVSAYGAEVYRDKNNFALLIENRFYNDGALCRMLINIIQQDATIEMYNAINLNDTDFSTRYYKIIEVLEIRTNILSDTLQPVVNLLFYGLGIDCSLFPASNYSNQNSYNSYDTYNTPTQTTRRPPPPPPPRRPPPPPPRRPAKPAPSVAGAVIGGALLGAFIGGSPGRGVTRGPSVRATPPPKGPTGPSPGIGGIRGPAGPGLGLGRGPGPGRGRGPGRR